MESETGLERLGRERAAPLEEAASIVQAAEARTVTNEEDARVLELMARVRRLEEQLGHLKRRHRA